jgi:hypothetical protein
MANPDDVKDLVKILNGIYSDIIPGTVDLAESILNHPASRWNACPHLVQGDSGSNYCRLAEQGAPGVAPVSITERPWERPGWCDAEGRCWFGAPQDGAYSPQWLLRNPPNVCNSYTHSAPHYAIPIPPATTTEEPADV